jgi:hypothetical protein
MARPVARTRTPNGKAVLQVYMDADLRDRLARAAFEEGLPVSTVVSRAVRAELAAMEAPQVTSETPQAHWVDLGADGWRAQGVPCPASPSGATLVVDRDLGDIGWRWAVRVDGVIAAAGGAGTPLRSRTAAMLEAEAQAAVLTAEDVAAGRKRAARLAKRLTS